MSLGRSPHIAIGLSEAIKKTGIGVVGHHHDFYWEREYFSNPQHKAVEELIAKYFPPVELTHMEHVVINSPAKMDLYNKRGVSSMVVPNVF